MKKYILGLILSLSTFKHNTERHHIIARTADKAKIARNIWIYKCHKGINDEENIAKVKPVLHKVLHRNEYYELVNFSVETAYTIGGVFLVTGVLKGFKEVLEHGK